MAGIDDDPWETDEKKTKHVGMGGKFLRDFAVGLSDDDMNKIVLA